MQIRLQGRWKQTRYLDFSNDHRSKRHIEFGESLELKNMLGRERDSQKCREGQARTVEVVSRLVSACV